MTIINNKILKDFKSWHKGHNVARDQQKHEVMKALLFKHGDNPIPEYKLPGYDKIGKEGIVDYKENNLIIEIDSRRNEAALRRLAYARDVLRMSVLWIVILPVGEDGERVFDRALYHHIPLLRIFARWNCFYYKYSQ